MTKKCLLKLDACLLYVNLYLFVMTGNQNTGLLRQVACLIEVAMKTGFIVEVKRELSKLEYARSCSV